MLREIESVKRRYIDLTGFTRCGLRENVCPHDDRTAIRVPGPSEFRHPDNRPILGATR